jgi:uncharacterized protein
MTADEVLICNDADIAALDERMADIYFGIRQRMKGSARFVLEAEQSAWLRSRKECGRNKECIEASYLSRIRQLSPVEVGDVVWLSSNGVGETVIALNRENRETVELITRKMEANAAEYCERYEDLSSESPKWKKCIQDNVSSTISRIIVNCRTSTIILDGQAGGPYRRAAASGGGPWISVANPNWIIQGDSIFDAACKRR